ncbi:hypothetical protein NIES267_53720 [Calothrix parasitica NIES-267]|uniref:Uncharacterized protein n=1 Tax=Calothrix parasitica NIES-267 TaxID=1973488 RepID=A0A1Z4LX86_9CYAN|nr:hypothetical protein NIES267_53720 [Calothrix parasitica NIES-267]
MQDKYKIIDFLFILMGCGDIALVRFLTVMEKQNFYNK